MNPEENDLSHWESVLRWADSRGVRAETEAWCRGMDAIGEKWKVQKRRNWFRRLFDEITGRALRERAKAGSAQFKP